MKPFGPVHEYVAPATGCVKRLSVVPAQIGPLFVAVAVAEAIEALDIGVSTVPGQLFVATTW